MNNIIIWHVQNFVFYALYVVVVKTIWGYVEDGELLKKVYTVSGRYLTLEVIMIRVSNHISDHKDYVIVTLVVLPEQVVSPILISE